MIVVYIALKKSVKEEKMDKSMPFTSLKKNYMWFEGITWDGSLF